MTEGIPDAKRESSCRTRILDDQPADADKFGPHTRVAEAVADVIRGEVGGRVLGLTGAYGVGKSTVVGLLGRFLANSAHAFDVDCVVWKFDVRAHEGDPLRRTFLESLVATLVGRKWIDADKWRRVLDELARKRKQMTSRTTPNLQRIGWALAASLLLIGIGQSLFSNALRNGLGLEGSVGDISWQAVVGVVLAIGPGLVILGALAYRALQKKRGEAGAQDLLALFVQRTVTDTTTETIETPEPTSLEFEHHFRDLMSEALELADRRLVLVVDNLDRIADAEFASRVWSTLQIFLQADIVPRPSWLDRLWVAVTYDRSAMLSLFCKSGAPSNALDKYVNLQFDVPPALITHWQSYLVDLLIHALPDHDPRDFNIVPLLVTSEGHGVESLGPVPRDLKILVNQIGILHRQYKHEIPFGHLAYFALLNRKRSGLISDLTAQRGRDEICATAAAQLLGDDLADSLVALAFGVDVPKARELLLREPITEALMIGDDKRIGDLSNRSGFIVVLTDTVRDVVDRWRTNGPQLPNAAFAIGSGWNCKPEEGWNRHAMFEFLRDASLQIEAFKPVDDRVARGLIYLLESAPSAIVAEGLLLRMSRAIHDSGAADKGEWLAPAHAATWVAAEYERLGFGNLLRNNGMLLPQNFSNAVTLATSIDNERIAPDHPVWQVFRPAELAEFSTELIKTTQTGAFRYGHAALVRLLVAVSDETPDPTWVNNALARLNIGQPSVDELGPLLRALNYCAEYDDSVGQAATAARDKLIRDGALAHNYATIIAPGNKPDPRADAIIAWKKGVNFAKFGSSNTIMQGYNLMLKDLTEAQSPVTQAVGLAAYRLNDPQMLFDMPAVSPNTRTFAEGALAAYLTNADAVRTLSAPMIVKHWDLLAHTGAASNVVDSWNAELVETIPHGEWAADRVNLYILLVASDLGGSAEWLDWIVSQLLAIDAEGWKRALSEDPSELVTLALSVKRRRERFGLRGALSQALEAVAVEVVNGEFGEQRRSDWASVCDLLDSDERVLFRDKIFEIAIVDDKLLAEQESGFFDMFGSELALSDHMTNDSRAVSKLLNPIVERRNLDGLRWMARTFVADGNWLSGQKDASKRSLRRMLDDALKAHRAEDSLEVRDLLGQCKTKLDSRYGT